MSSWWQWIQFWTPATPAVPPDGSPTATPVDRLAPATPLQRQEIPLPTSAASTLPPGSPTVVPATPLRWQGITPKQEPETASALPTGGRTVAPETPLQWQGISVENPVAFAATPGVSEGDSSAPGISKGDVSTPSVSKGTASTNTDSTAVEQVELGDPPDSLKGHGCRCTPPPRGEKRRNLVVCIDGTAKQFGSKNTHVLELYRRLVADKTQLTYYDSGIGTYVPSSNGIVRAKQKLESYVAQGIALHHQEITLRAYQWLSENYVTGDRIYLLGFSRGAYIVRIISGMIKTVGLLRKGNNNQIAFAYQLYLETMEKARQRPGKETDSGSTRTLCAEFQQTLCNKDVTVHFVGVWDTVSSIGITRGSAFPETSDGMVHVCVFRHALALHELRVKFLPDYAWGGKGPPVGAGNVKEVWFAGSHSDIGGGNTKTEHSILNAAPPLRWMMYEAIEHDLRIEPYRAVQSAVVHCPSMTAAWRILEVYPWRRLSYGQSAADLVRWPLHLCQGRHIQPGQHIHESAVDYLERSTDISARTKAKFFDARSGSWVSVQDHLDAIKAQTSDLKIEKDHKSKAIAAAIAGLDTARRSHGPFTDDLRSILWSLSKTAVGRQLIVDQLGDAENINRLLDILRRASLETPKREKDLEALYTILEVFIMRPKTLKIRPSLYRWVRFSNPSTAAKIMRTFGFITGHTDTIQSIAYSPTEHIIASGSLDGTVKLWNSVTGQPMAKTLELPRRRVRAIAFSPDGRSVAVASSDNHIRVWRLDKDRSNDAKDERSLVEHNQDVHCVAFSPGPDGVLLAFGSTDKKVRVHDADTGKAVGQPLCGHEATVLSVAFSSDDLQGLRLASGSSDYTVRIWDVGSGQQVRVLRGHDDIVTSVAFSRMTGYVVSGSKDMTAKLWSADAHQGRLIATLEGHTDDVNAVAVSPDGRYIASGSDDRTVRLWNAETGEAIGEPLEGHTKIVRSVAFSLDSLNVVSGSAELLIWEVPLQRNVQTLA
ncbi:hypothetical protein PHLGIDRAFT_218517 [Phlebiopsis gigantea 11061_1 CR5-6]|uniref:T6SS Phospholipase effector Tle1-like catalytic domain-containing protein n=1 Tax=Phlebiopsis gigantea (strain 11061_1 CR5-6) TaxID=745531 RepID=A0A0C3NGL3_PHLG1|nr:hypothetical protein PHLGIDRAFT_218517 [Phlebiopsis gigantea 11061_1 CR5-6]